MKNLLILSLFVSSFAFGQKNSLNDAVRANTPAPGIIGDALDGARALTATGTDTYVITTAAAFQPYAGAGTYAAGDMWTIVFTNANTSTTTSINIDSEGAIALKDNEGNDLAVGDLKAGGTYKFRYTGTNFRMVGSVGAAVVTASNAITKTGNVFSLGGAFNQNTTHDGNGFHWTVGASGNRLGNLRAWAGLISLDATTAATFQVGSSTMDLSTIAATLGSASGAITLNPTNLLVSDSRGTPKGLEYNADYSANYSSRSLVDKAYVDAAAGGGGDVVGPASATNNVPVLFDGTTGKLIKNSTPTGTGNPVLATSPTLVTPDIGTPSAGVGTNITGIVSSTVIFTPTGTIAATNVQTAIAEVATDAATALGAATKTFAVAVTDETTAITTGGAKITFHMPYACTVDAVYCGLSTAQTTGSLITIDINEAGVSILSTKITLDNNEKHSGTAATPPVISDTSLAQFSEITIDIDQVGASTIAAGLKCYIVNH